MKHDDHSTLSLNEVFAMAIRAATEKVLGRRHLPPGALAEIDVCADRLRTVLAPEPIALRSDHDEESIDEHGLAEWEESAWLRAAVLAALLSNDVAQA